MQELDDHALLHEYAEHHSEEAFGTLVNRHVDKVYSVALRHTRSPNQAEEITQAVFVLLAGKCGQLGKKVILEGWLYQTARLMSLTTTRAEIRRARREEESMMRTVNETEPEVWKQITPLLDAAIASLNETEQHAVVLRFFYGKSLGEVGAALGSSEGAATQRVHRALEKLRGFFAKHGIRSTTEILAWTISAHSVQAAPAALSKTIAAAAANGLAASGATLGLTKGAAHTVTWLKATTLAVVLANAFLSQKIVATHFNLAGNPNGWMTQSQSSLIWLTTGVGLPLFLATTGYLVRFLPVDLLNLPNREYWLAEGRRQESFNYFFRQFLWMACFAAIFILTQILLQIQANQRTPAHLSTPLVLLCAAGFIAAIVGWHWAMLRHFRPVPGAS